MVESNSDRNIIYYIRLLTNIQQYGMSLVNNVPNSEEGMRKVSTSNT